MIWLALPLAALFGYVLGALFRRAKEEEIWDDGYLAACESQLARDLRALERGEAQ